MPKIYLFRELHLIPGCSKLYFQTTPCLLERSRGERIKLSLAKVSVFYDALNEPPLSDSMNQGRANDVNTSREQTDSPLPENSGARSSYEFKNSPYTSSNH